MAAAIEAEGRAKGWCPGALRPMRSGDGLIVRVRPHLGVFSLGEARALAGLAARLGNGHIDLTRRANLQIRGLDDDGLPELQDELRRLGLVDASADAEAVRNIMVSPLADAGSETRRIAAELEAALADDRRLHGLPTKFGLLVDAGGRASIAGERADISLRAVGKDFAVGLDSASGTRWLGACSARTAVKVVLTMMHAFLDGAPRRRLRDLAPEDRLRLQAAVMPLLTRLPPCEAIAGRALGLVEGAVGVAAPFGRLEADQLVRLAAAATAADARELRLSPWRTVYIPVPDGHRRRRLLQEADAIGLIVRDDSPLLRIEACPGAPDCESASVDARGDARRLAGFAAARGFTGSIHVSGCAKGCAKSAPSDLLLIGEAGRYRLARNGQRQGMVEAGDLASVFSEAGRG